MSIAMESTSSSHFAGGGGLLTSQQSASSSSLDTATNQNSIPASNTPSPQPNIIDSTTNNDISANLSAILNAAKNSSVNLVNARQQSPTSSLTETNTFEKEIEAQQKAFQRFTSSLNDLGFRSPFPVNVIPPFLAALQHQNPLSIHSHLMNNLSNDPSTATSAAAAAITSSILNNNCILSPNGLDDEDDENDNENDNDSDNIPSTEPEDLTIGFRKEKKENLDDNADSEASAQQNWSYEEQFKQSLVMWSFTFPQFDSNYT
ncbi:unnamed protein product [Anisakis simplex]|uniref:Uncharacterized protein n=1 Tax=Anisakis simplex TaxID=6269 RepID=A0A0M3K6X5_ANISI|nr:unnamed protein product [Anisakis simplex]